MIRDIGSSIGNAIAENIGRAAGRVQENKPLPSDLLESDDAYLVVFDAPGTTASDIQVRYIDDRVEVRIDRFRDFYDGFEMRYPGRGLALDGSVTLPSDAVVDPETAQATLKSNGTLHVRVPKAETDHDEDDVTDVGVETDDGEADAESEADADNETADADADDAAESADEDDEAA
ncbi:Hsp20/alpha crystallin family protein [Haloarcula sp. S1AR25-5A]|uniref:Hsp20/alpha crystallin family protein n=1 Tax=Haloarcula terrestris TaxID=2950533 RepID=A0AAE4EWR8_9EURY|nr:Hsp20/alpha crystallin family protein [Haloarcula terrestris]MDS0220667.1 Hsp20/alpha crystallin family protein [Haloarcula terrestris]